MSALPGSTMLRHETRKYLPHAVPKSTLSNSNKYKKESGNETVYVGNHQITQILYPQKHKYGFKENLKKKASKQGTVL